MDHGTLTGLGDDDHSQYLLATGARAANEIRLTPKAASTGPEGTMFYCSDDDSIYVATAVEFKQLYREGGKDVAVADGGTGLSSYAIGDLLYASAATTLAKLADVAVGGYLASGGVGVAPAWATLNQAAVAGLTTVSSPVFVTVKLSGLTDGYIPYHVDDTTGLANSTFKKVNYDLQMYSLDAYPSLLLHAGAAHDDCGIAFDAYSTDGITWFSSDVGSNYVMYKTGDKLTWYFAEAYAPGSTITWTKAFELLTTGDLYISNGTISCSDLTNGYHPYHVSDAVGLANGPIWTNGSLVGIGQASVASGFTLDVNGFIRTVQTVDQNASASVDARQTASTLQDGSASTGTSELFDNQWEAMKFTASAAHNMRSIQVRLKSSATLTNGSATIRAYIYADSNPTGSGGSPTGAALATSTTTVKFGSLTTTMTTLNFGILSVALTSGSHYWIVLRWSEAPTGGTISIDTAAAGTGEWSKSADGAAWTNEDSKRGWFKILGRTLTSVYGYNTNSIGVLGDSVNSYGVSGQSINGYGVYGQSTNAQALFGVSVNSTGMAGGSTNGYGIAGSSTNSYGIYAESTNSAGLVVLSYNHYAAYFLRNTATPANALPVVYVNQAHASDTNPALKVNCVGSGDMLQLFDGGVASLVYKDTGLLGIATASPVCRLEVEDGNTSKDMLVKITAYDSNVYALIIGNDTYSPTDTDGLRFYVENNGDPYISWTGPTLWLGFGIAGQDIVLGFYGETNLGYLSWMEDENYFQFDNEILIAISNGLYFRDTAIGLYSQADSYLDFFADGGIRIGDSSAGAPTNYAKFAPDGELNLVGTARVTKDVQLPLSGFGKGAAAPGDVYLGNYFGYEFTTNDTIYLSTEIPYDRDPSANLIIEIQWYVNEAVGSPVKEVAWEVYYTCTKENGTELVDAVSATLPSGDIVIPTLAKALTQTNFTVPAAAIEADDVIGIIIKRVAIAGGTAPTAKPVIVGAMLEYIANKLGEAT